MVTVRDLHLVETLRDVDPQQVRVEEAMTPYPYVVAPDALLRDVCLEMADRKLGSAVVVSGHKVVGVLTTVDALRALADALR
jgi:acetoin utilization protein AcuB